MNITLADIVHTRPLTKYEHNYLDRKLERVLKEGAGKNKPFRLAVGDKVENFAMFTEGNAQPVGTVQELYRENGHNRVATEKGFFREDDLRKII